MSANDKNGCFWCVNRDGAEPEVQTSVFMAQANVPQQQVDRAVRQEKLQS